MNDLMNQIEGLGHEQVDGPSLEIHRLDGSADGAGMVWPTCGCGLPPVLLG